MQLGMIGLGRMGANIVRRLAKGGHDCVVYDHDPDAVKAMAGEDRTTGVASLRELSQRLSAPRVVWVMVPAGNITTAVIEELANTLEAGDIVIDGGNTYYRDDLRHEKLLFKKGIHLLDCGTSGGVWGRERGYCLMIGGDGDAFARAEPIFATARPRQPGRGCPVAAAPAVSSVNGTVVVSVWQPGEPAAKLVGLKYHAEQLVREWTSDAVSAGVLASPVLSADGSTVYVNGRDHRLWALNAADGKAKWSAPLGFLAQTPPALTPHGLIVSGGGPDTALAAFRDAGDHAEGAWRRDDVTALSTASLAGTGVGYTVISGPNHDGTPGLSLLVFDPANGHTVNSYPLPGATGYPVGVSVGNDRRVVTATSDGQVYSFAP